MLYSIIGMHKAQKDEEQVKIKWKTQTFIEIIHNHWIMENITNREK